MLHAFDTLRATKALLDAGFEQTQAEAVARTVHEAMGENVATKADLDKTETALRTDMEKMETAIRADMEKMESRLDARMAELSRDLHKQFWVMGFGIVSLTVALIKLL